MARSKKRKKAKRKVDDVGTEKRRMATLLYVLEHGIADVSEVAGHLKCHRNSVLCYARSLQKMCPYIGFAGQNTIVSLVPTRDNEGLLRRMIVNPVQKRRIAARALEMISPGDVVFLGGGATTFYLAVALAKSDRRNVVVLTNHLWLHGILLPRVGQLRSPGGTVNKRVGLVEFAPGSLAFQKASITRAFLGVEGLSYDAGAYCGKLDVALQREVALERAESVVILADRSKFGKSAGERFLLFEELEDREVPYRIVTDAPEGGEGGDGWGGGDFGFPPEAVGFA